MTIDGQESYQPETPKVETIKNEHNIDSKIEPPKRDIVERATNFAKQVSLETNRVGQADWNFVDNAAQNLNRFKGDYNTTTSQPELKELRYKVEPIIRDIDQKISALKSITNNFGLDQPEVQSRLENILHQISETKEPDQIKVLVANANQLFQNNIDKLSNDRDQSRFFKNKLNDSVHQNEMSVRQSATDIQRYSSIKPGSGNVFLLERCQNSSRFLASQIDSGVQTSNQIDISFKKNIHEYQKQFIDSLQYLTKSGLTN